MALSRLLCVAVISPVQIKNSGCGKVLAGFRDGFGVGGWRRVVAVVPRRMVDAVVLVVVSIVADRAVARLKRLPFAKSATS